MSIEQTSFNWNTTPSIMPVIFHCSWNFSLEEIYKQQAIQICLRYQMMIHNSHGM